MSKIIKKFNPKFPHFRKNKHVKTKQKYFLIISRTISKFGSELKSNCVLMKTISKNKLQALKLLEIDRNLLKKYSKHSFLYPSKKKNKCPWEINIPVALQKEVTKIMNSKPGKIAINDKPELDAIGDNEEIQEYDEDSVDTGDLIIHISSSSSECSSPEKFNIIQDDNQFDHVESDEKCYEDQMDFECQYCSTKFKQQKSLDFHIEKQHLEIDIQNKFSSTHLDKLLQCKQILKEHLNIHDVSNYNLKCHECDKFFSNSLHLSLHKETHLVDYEYDCEKCDKKFKTKNLLNCHQCKYCKK